MRNSPSPPLQGIHQALAQGCRLQAFLAGVGLRVVCLKYNEELRGYGEHPHLEEALELCSTDFLSGGQSERVFYVTGDPVPSDRLDAWLRNGNTMECWQEEEHVICILSGSTEKEWDINRRGIGPDILAAIIAAVNALPE